MTVELGTEPGEATSEDAETATPLASWSARAAAFALDVVAVVLVAAVLVMTVAQFDGAWWAYAAVVTGAVVVIAVNRWWFAAQTGWTLGRKVVGIRVEAAAGDERVGLGRLILRDGAHLLDTFALLVGWLWPLWDPRHRTFADLLCRTEVRGATAPDGSAAVRRAGIALVVATVLAVAGTGAAFAQFWHNRAIGQARQQISEQGPRIVEQILSYHADSYKDDFKNAQSLVTDGYRDQLTKQQQVLTSKGAPTTNALWAVSSAVLEPVTDPDRVSMLVALQGQRGADVQSLKLITATVRVQFEKSSDGKWQLGSLQVLQRPAVGAAQSIPQPPPASKPPAPAPAPAPAPKPAPSTGGTR